MAKAILAYIKHLFQEHESKNQNCSLQVYTSDALFLFLLTRLFELHRQQKLDGKLQKLIDVLQNDNLEDSSTEE